MKQYKHISKKKKERVKKKVTERERKSNELGNTKRGR